MLINNLRRPKEIMKPTIMIKNLQVQCQRRIHLERKRCLYEDIGNGEIRAASPELRQSIISFSQSPNLFVVLLAPYLPDFKTKVSVHRGSWDQAGRKDRDRIQRKQHSADLSHHDSWQDICKPVGSDYECYRTQGRFCSDLSSITILSFGRGRI